MSTTATAPAVEVEATPSTEPAALDPAKATGEQLAALVSPEQVKEIYALRTDGDGLTLKEIADRTGIPGKAVSFLLKGVEKPATAKKSDGPGFKETPSKEMATVDWAALVSGLPQGIAAGKIAWVRESYCMVRADFSTGPARTHFAEFPFPWATVCGHGTFTGTAKGGQAENAGKARADWCPQCKAGEAFVVPTKERATPVRKEKAEGDVPAEPVTPEQVMARAAEAAEKRAAKAKAGRAQTAKAKKDAEELAALAPGEPAAEVAAQIDESPAAKAAIAKAKKARATKKEEPVAASEQPPADDDLAQIA